ncbi:hypothetical protein M0R45_025187 [Rubus argutus]|uniref:Uncharacterized protein n=1 Tax=Rubus argutus TaxID=59490 RepID=A0AAW1WVL6_RUBAR
MEGSRGDDISIDTAACQQIRQHNCSAEENVLRSSGLYIDTGSVESDLTSSMENIASQNSFLSNKCCIFETPKILFRHNENAYVPFAFSIGPLHHGKPHLIGTEEIKLKYMQDLLSQLKGSDPNRSATILKTLVEDIATLEDVVRQCYAVPVRFSRNEFIKILLVDGCFLVELFRKRASERRLENDPIFTRPCMHAALGYDLFLLENQIPWMVLDRLFSRTTFPSGMLLTQLAVNYFHLDYFARQESEMVMYSMPSTLNHSNHILDLLRNTLVWSAKPQGGGIIGTWTLIPSASSLMEAGVKFKKGGKSNGILNIKFNDGVLEIPPLVIHESSETIFRNMISFEQCYHSCYPSITSYAILLDCLINTPKDIEILCENGIIQNWLNPDEATQIFNNLYNDAYVTKFYYLELCQDINNYCKLRWPRWRAMYVRNHFSSPWAIASQVLAAIIFILSLLQTVFSIKK